MPQKSPTTVTRAGTLALVVRFCLWCCWGSDHGKSHHSTKSWSSDFGGWALPTIQLGLCCRKKPITIATPGNLYFWWGGNFAHGALQNLHPQSCMWSCQCSGLYASHVREKLPPNFPAPHTHGKSKPERTQGCRHWALKFWRRNFPYPHFRGICRALYQQSQV